MVTRYVNFITTLHSNKTNLFAKIITIMACELYCVTFNNMYLVQIRVRMRPRHTGLALRDQHRRVRGGAVRPRQVRRRRRGVRVRVLRGVRGRPLPDRDRRVR